MNNDVELIVAWDKAVKAAKARGMDLSYDVVRGRFELKRNENELLGIGWRVIDMAYMVAEAKENQG